MSETVRPTKKQRDILTYIEQFIGEHGYSPSYREIMNGLNYTSVATVSLHVNSLIRRGHIRKRDRSARSLEVVGSDIGPDLPVAQNITASQEKWLVDRIESMISRLEKNEQASTYGLQEMTVLVDALKVLECHAAAARFVPRLAQLQVTVADTDDSMRNG
ncbi:MAG TPA: hypothetical protein VF575_04690 [Candidatus Saccharimonadales bacterium]|jgi:repressor LexA